MAGMKGGMKGVSGPGFVKGKRPPKSFVATPALSMGGKGMKKK